MHHQPAVVVGTLSVPFGPRFAEGRDIWILLCRVLISACRILVSPGRGGGWDSGLKAGRRALLRRALLRGGFGQIERHRAAAPVQYRRARIDGAQYPSGVALALLDPCCSLKRFIKENRDSTVLADDRSNQGERRRLRCRRLRGHSRGWRGGDRRRPRAARRREKRAIARRRELRNGNGPQGIPRCREFGRRVSGVGRPFAVQIGLGAFGLDRGKRDCGRSGLGQACYLARKNCDPGDGERRASHWESRHCPDTTTRTRIGVPSASPKA